MTNKALSRQNKTGKFVPCCAENSVPEAAGAEATSHNVFLLNRVHVNLIIREPGAGQTKGFRPLLDVFFLASTRFLEHLTMPTDGALTTKCYGVRGFS